MFLLTIRNKNSITLYKVYIAQPEGEGQFGSERKILCITDINQNWFSFPVYVGVCHYQSK